MTREKAVKRALLEQVAQITKKAQNGTKLSDLDTMLVEARAGLQEQEGVAADPCVFSVADMINAEIREAEPCRWSAGNLGKVGQLSQCLTAQYQGEEKQPLPGIWSGPQSKAGHFLSETYKKAVAVLCPWKRALDSVEGASYDQAWD